MSAAAKDASEPPKKKSKLLLISVVAVVVLGAGGGGAWFFLKPSDPNAVHTAAPKPAVFLPLEAFTVNLVPQDGQQQYLQAGLTLKLGEQVKETVIREKMPEIRDRILMVLSSKKASDVLPVAGKQKLAREIVAAVQAVVGVAAAPKPAQAPVQAEPAAGEAAAATLPAAKAAAEGEHAEAEAAAPPPPPVKKAVAAPQIEVLFTSFIVQ